MRALGPDDCDQFVAVHRAAYLRRPGEGDADALASTADLTRAVGAFDGRRLVAIARSFATTLTVPGRRLVPAASICNVAVLATHRRRGLAGRLMADVLDDARGRGEAVALLVPSEWPIYGRYGFGPATSWARWRIDVPAPLRPDVAVEPVELVDPVELRTLAPPAFARHHEATVGTIDREPSWWGTRYGDPSRFAVVHRDRDGAVDGWAVYGGTMRWDHGRPDGEVTVDELISASPVAWRSLWAHVLGTDLVRVVDAWVRPADEPVPLLLADGRRVRAVGRSDHLWARLLDVPAALGARVATASVAVVVEVVAPDGSRQAWRVLGSPGQPFTVLDAVNAAPYLTLPAAALGAAYLGGTALSSWADAGLVEEHRPGSVTALSEALATTPAPWCSTGF